MQKIKIQLGEDIGSAARQLVEAAPASCEFNGITLTAREGDTPESIVAFYTKESERRAKAYRESPEGRRAERRRQVEIENLQKKADALMARLPGIFTGPSVLGTLDQILGWLCEAEEPRDHVGVRMSAGEIVAAFRAHGYEPNVNCGADFNEHDPDNFARWIIGQSISIPYVPITSRFVEQWRAKFAVPQGD